MIKVGQKLVLGEKNGFFEIFDIECNFICRTQQFIEIGDIYDIIAIEDSDQLLLAGYRGLLKRTKDQVTKHYFQGKRVNTICHNAESLYFIGLANDGLIVWNEKTDQQLVQVCKDRVFSIKRILTTNSYIIKTMENGLKLITIKNLEKS